MVTGRLQTRDPLFAPLPFSWFPFHQLSNRALALIVNSYEIAKELSRDRVKPAPKPGDMQDTVPNPTDPRTPGCSKA